MTLRCIIICIDTKHNVCVKVVWSIVDQPAPPNTFWQCVSGAVRGSVAVLADGSK